jgi:hypothetical protein
VLGPFAPRTRVPCFVCLQHSAAVLARPALTLGPNNQCSTSEHPSCCSAPARLSRGDSRGSPPGKCCVRASAKVVNDHRAASARLGRLLLRKEVIQPHLPVRLPCYDFVPIAGPTFDGSLPCGLGHRLRVLPTFVT